MATKEEDKRRDQCSIDASGWPQWSVPKEALRTPDGYHQEQAALDQRCTRPFSRFRELCWFECLDLI